MTNKEFNLIEKTTEFFDNWMRDLGIFDGAELVNILDVMDLRKRVYKINKEFIRRVKKDVELDEIDCKIVDKLAGDESNDRK